MNQDPATIADITDEDGRRLDVLDGDGETIASAVQDGSRWGIYADDGLELPVAYVGDEAAARAWLDFIAHLSLLAHTALALNAKVGETTP